MQSYKKNNISNAKCFVIEKVRCCRILYPFPATLYKFSCQYLSRCFCSEPSSLQLLFILITRNMTTTISKFAHLQIPLEDVVKATNNFHHDNIIGRGGLGLVYKGQLQRSGELITISALRLDRKHGGGVVEFWTEVSMLSNLKHPNIVSIVGFCDEKHEKIIVTTYEAKNGSLKEHLNSPNLTWTQRLKICVGVARALSYVHYDEGRGYGVIHLNINSSTILLNENWEPKLSGFKVSIKQSLNRMNQVVLSEPIGTIGYVDPEIEKTKGVTYKSDIYSFGVVLFEILCGRKAFVPNDANRLLAPLAIYQYEKKMLKEIIHPALWNQMSPRSLEIYSKVAYSCINGERTNRMDTSNIVNELEKALESDQDFQLKHLNLVRPFFFYFCFEVITLFPV
uniref:Protein kinase domain-containing protein n=2 Tax=Helianthus annuus TaxID=4232 RepID=A0A251TE84_HELAN